MSSLVVCNQDIIANLSNIVWGEMVYYIKKGYLEKKIMINHHRFFKNKMSTIEAWDAIRQRKTQVLSYINLEILKDSGLLIVEADFDWEIQDIFFPLYGKKVYHTLFFKLIVPPPLEEMEESLTTRKPTSLPKQQVGQNTLKVGGVKVNGSDTGSVSRFKVSSS
jgi:hypothetical protein